MVGAIAQELVDQIAIGAVQLHSVKACFLGVLSRAAIIADCARNVLTRHFARGDIFLLAHWRVRFARRLGRAGRKWRLTIEEIGVNDPPHVPQLHHDHAARFVHAFDNWLPRFGLLIAPDAGCRRPAKALYTDAGCLGQDHARTCSLAVIGAHHFVRREHRIGGPAACERGHEYAVLGFKRAHC